MLVEDIKKSKRLYVIPDVQLLESFLSSEVDVAQLQNMDSILSDKYEFDHNTDVSENEVEELLDILENEFDDQKFDNLISACKQNVLQSIVTPFGLGRIISSFDKNGGNVTTLHNFRDGVVATEEDNKRYQEWKNRENTYNHKDYEKDFNKKRKEIFKNTNDLRDGYTGKEIPKDGGSHLDHVIPAKKMHQNPKNHFYMDRNHRENMSVNDKNLVMTDRSLNMSKGEKDLNKWANSSNSENQEMTNAEKYGCNSKLLKEKHKKAKNYIKNEQIKAQIKKQGQEIVSTGAKEGLKMGSQQAIGLLLTEFFSATFDEVRDIYKDGYYLNDTHNFIATLKYRLKRMAERIAARWKDNCKVFSEGFISGLLSNLVTVVINMFVRTGKRIVRIIREGFFSLLRAIKLLCFPPEGMTFAQAAHEASKLIAAGLTIIGGIALEQYIDTLIKATPVVEPIADIITSILIGALTGITTTFIVYAIDKIDFFKINDKEKHNYIVKEIEGRLQKFFDSGDTLIEELAW